MKLIETEQLKTLSNRVWNALRDPQRWRQALTRNLSLKILSLMIAFGLWSFVNFGERDTEDTLKVPLELRNIPPQLMITSPRVDFIDVRVSGPRTLLGRVDRNRLSLPLDMSGVKPGPAVFRVVAESLVLPRGVRVVRINPAQVTIELERVTHKTVPVRVRLIGKPPPDLRIADTKVSPEMVQVSGPATDIEDVTVASTQPIDISKATNGTIERELPLEAAGDYVSFSASRVAIQLRIEDVAITREIKGVPITVRNATLERTVSPATTRLVVRGAKQLVESLEPAPYVDAADHDAGEHILKPKLDLPEGVELVTIDPATVKLVLSAKRPKRPAR
jgi:YbbR domain-containing protein